MLVTSALLGVERRPLQFGPETPALVGQLASDDDAQTLLRAAAVLAVQRRAGYAPPHDDSVLPLAPEETLPCCSRRAAHHLAELLSDPNRYHPMLVEWLAKTGQKGRRVPYGMLPPLFDITVRRKELWSLVALVGGERGRWLAAQNPTWRRIAEVDLDDARQAIHNKPAPAQMDEVLKALAIEPGGTSEPLLQQLLAGVRSLSSEIAELLFGQLLAKPDPKVTHVNVHSLSQLAMSVTPDLLGQVTARVRQMHASGVNDLEPVIRLLEFRAEMLRELDRD